jgi:hypothetical protein
MIDDRSGSPGAEIRQLMGPARIPRLKARLEPRLGRVYEAF